MALPLWLQTLRTRLPEQRTRWVPLTGSGSGNLSKIDHIVVLMMENRSFDHMLGYLKLDGVIPEMEGLEADMANEYSGRSYPVHPLGRAGLEGFNPEHGGPHVDHQLENNNGGFVADFATDHPTADPGLVMGYYNGEELPVYDHLARNYCVCDHWFSSVPGATWPNRLFSITGGAITRESTSETCCSTRTSVSWTRPKPAPAPGLLDRPQLPGTDRLHPPLERRPPAVRHPPRPRAPADIRPLQVK